MLSPVLNTNSAVTTTLFDSGFQPTSPIYPTLPLDVVIADCIKQLSMGRPYMTVAAKIVSINSFDTTIRDNYGKLSDEAFLSQLKVTLIDAAQTEDRGTIYVDVAVLNESAQDIAVLVMVHSATAG
jgi:hypothetical protein